VKLRTYFFFIHLMHRFARQLHYLKDRKINPVAFVRERTVPTERPLSARLVPTFADRGCHVLSATNPYGRILGFLDRSFYYFLK
jgi:CBS-domain-containing membrane protein